MLSTRTVAVAAASAGAIVALAGCGSSSGPSAGSSGASPTSSLQDVQSAYTSTVGQKSAKLSLVEHLNVGGHALTINGAGAESFADKKFTLTTTVAGQQIEIRELGQVLYEKLPAAASSHLPGGKPWISVNLNTLVQHLTGASLSELEAGQQEDPANTLSYLKQASASGLHRVGTATVRGVPTTEYTATIDLNKVAAAQPGAVAKAIKAEEKSLGTSSYPISVWVDANHLVRQLGYHTTVSPGVVSDGWVGRVLTRHGGGDVAVLRLRHAGHGHRAGRLADQRHHQAAAGAGEGRARQHVGVGRLDGLTDALSSRSVGSVAAAASASAWVSPLAWRFRGRRENGCLVRGRDPLVWGDRRALHR